MPTIKDIAKYAGVSHGTVSNVLNRKGNVSAEKIKLVEQAAKELGYQLNSQARQLRSGSSKHICIIVPRMDRKMYNELYSGMEQELKKAEYTIELLCSNGLQYIEERVLNKALSSNPKAIIMVSSLIENKESIPEETQIIMVDRYIKGFSPNAIFVSFNYEKAGKEIAEKCVRDGNKSIAILCEDVRYTNNKKFVENAARVFKKEGCYVEVFSAPDPMKFNRVFDVLDSPDPFDAIVVMSREDAESIKMAHRYNPTIKLPNIYAIVNKEIGFQNINMYEMNYKLMGRHIAEIVMEKEGLEERNEIIEHGCFPIRKTYHFQKGKTLQFLSVKNPTSRAIKKLLPLFKEQSGIDVKVTEVPYDELYKMVSKMGVNQETVFDLVRIDMAWMARESERIFRKLDSNHSIIKNVMNRILSCIPEEYYSVKGEKYAIPLDACVQMLFCRKDLFENELIKREYYEKNKKRLEIPKSFDEYNKVARFFTQKYNKQSPTAYGTTLTYGRSFVAACEVLLRYSEKKSSIFDEHGKVNVMTKEMQEAFQSCLESRNYTTDEIHQWWGESSGMFSDGLTAMNIAFSNYASHMLHNMNSKVAGKIIFADVPGENPLLGGGSLGVTKSSKKVEECYQFMDWLYSDEIAEMVTYLGGFVGNKNIVNNAAVLELYPWIAGIEEMFKKGKRGNEQNQKRGFDEFAFEDILGNALITAMSEKETIEEALYHAQEVCDNRFNKQIEYH